MPAWPLPPSRSRRGGASSEPSARGDVRPSIPLALSGKPPWVHRGCSAKGASVPTLRNLTPAVTLNTCVLTPGTLPFKLGLNKGGEGPAIAGGIKVPDRGSNPVASFFREPLGEPMESR